MPLGTMGDEATRDSRARADFVSEVELLESRRVAREFCVQTDGAVVVGELSGYRELCAECGLDGGLEEASGNRKYIAVCSVFYSFVSFKPLTDTRAPAPSAQR